MFGNKDLDVDTGIFTNFDHRDPFETSLQFLSLNRVLRVVFYLKEHGVYL